MKNLQFNSYQCGAGWVGSKKSKLISIPPRGAELKSCLISVLPPLLGGENQRGVKERGASQAE